MTQRAQAWRLTGMKTALIAGVVATISGVVATIACEVPLATDPSRTLSLLQLSPKSSSLRTGEIAQFVVVGLTSAGDTAEFGVQWSATGGTIVDTGTSGGKHYLRYQAPSQPGQYRVITQTTVAGLSTKNTVPALLGHRAFQLAALSTQSTAAELSDSAVIDVSAAPVASVSVSPASPSVTVGRTVQLTGTPLDSGSVALSGRMVTWASSDARIATVNDSGLVTGVAAGMVTITATSEGQSGASAVSVTAPVASVSVSPASVSLMTGQTVQLTATPLDASGIVLVGRMVTWASSHTATATVSGSGLVTAAGAGTVTITATSEGQSGASAVSVMAPVASVSVSPASLSLTIGQTVQLTATPLDASGNVGVGRLVTWASSDAGLAIVSGSGLVTGVAAGWGTITATSEGKSGTAAITVTTGSGGSVITNPSLVLTEATGPKPAYLVPITPSPFGLRVTRIANDPGQTMTLQNGTGTWGSDARQHYSKDQPWSADGSLIALQNNGAPRRVFLDGNTYAPTLGQCRNYPLGDDRWHPSIAHAHERINVKGSSLIWFDVVTCTQTRSWTLPLSVPGFGPWEGNPSFDGRYVALTDGTWAFLVDMDPQAPFAPYPERRIGPTVDLTDCGLSSGCTIDWVSVSASGEYVVVAYSGDYLRVYDVDPATLAFTPRPMPTIYPGCHGTAQQGFIYDVGHADMTLNPFDGNEDVIVGQEHCGNAGRTVAGQVIGRVMMVRLRDGAITPLTDPTNEAYPHHVSTRSYDRPGWAYVGYYYSSGRRFSNEIIAVKLDGSKSVERIAHTHTDDGCYRCEAHAVPSRDGLRVLWASDWMTNGAGTGSTSILQAFVVDTRP